MLEKNATNFDQNEYFTFKLHRYVKDKGNGTNDIFTHEDKIINMIPCESKVKENQDQNHNKNKEESQDEEHSHWNLNATLFCPDY